MPYMNLRNHRKVLVIDQAIGYTGGMNIRQGYLTSPPTVQDLHFRLEGPVVSHLLMSFAVDWHFACGQELEYSYKGQTQEDGIHARGIMAGPDSDLDKRRFVLLSALNRAEKRVRILTPYFVPDQTLLSAIKLARLRGVQVQIILPQKNNLRVLHWAATHLAFWLMEQGVEVFWSPPPFDHSKLMLVDDGWVCFGSGNWDARSLRLNFELDVECYNDSLAAQLNTVFERRINDSTSISAEAYRSLPALIRFRNALAHLLEPYL
jgi:cardiolipin synthase